MKSVGRHVGADVFFGVWFGRLAQLGEHLVYTERVGGSIPSAPTIRTFTDHEPTSRELVVGSRRRPRPTQPCWLSNLASTQNRVIV